MSNSTLRKDLFRIPVAADKLALFQLLYEADEINPNLALALLKVIHGELSMVQTPDRSVYKKYARVIQALRYKKAELLNQVADAWKNHNTPQEQDPEWLSKGIIK